MASLLFCDLSGIPVIKARLTIPYSRIWHADVTLDRAVPAPLVGPQLLNIAGAVYTCSVVRALDFVGSRSVRLVGGQGGWRKAVLPKPYAVTSGVSTLSIVSDAALAVKEFVPVLDPTIPVIQGTNFVRQGGAASLVLDQLLGDAWWMDQRGFIQTAPRLPTPILSPFTVSAVRGAAGIYTVETESPADWTPGRTFLGPTASGTINRVAHIIESGSFHTSVMVA